MPNEVLEVSKCFMRNPVSILVKKEELTLEGKFIFIEFCFQLCSFVKILCFKKFKNLLKEDFYVS